MSQSKIAIVGGYVTDKNQLKIFDLLCKDFDIMAYVLETSDSSNIVPNIGMPIKVFSEIPDMPGYMRGLEDELSDKDVIITCENTRLSSFQALRIGKKSKIPTIVYQSEKGLDKYESCKNIRAIIEEINGSASLVVASEQSIIDDLNNSTVQGRIKYIPSGFSQKSYYYRQNLRNRLCKHLKVDPCDFICVLKARLDKSNKLDQVIEAFSKINAHVKTTNGNASFLIFGDGECLDEIKYQIYDYGLGESTRIIVDFPWSYDRDVYSTADILICGDSIDSPYLVDGSRWLLDAVACGTRPILLQNAPETALTGSDDLTLDRDSEIIAQRVSELFWQFRHKGRRALALFDLFAWRSLERGNMANEWIEAINSLLVKNTKDEKSVEALQDMLSKRQYAGCLEEINRSGSCILDVDVALIKAAAEVGDCQFKDAMKTYTDILQHHGDQVGAYLGLGKISILSHSFEDAYSFYKKAFSLDEHSGDAAYGIGIAAKHLGRAEESLSWFSKCILFEPGHQKAVTAIAQVSKQCGDIGLAITLLEQVREIVGEEEASLMISLGQLYMRNGNDDLGKALLRGALEG